MGYDERRIYSGKPNMKVVEDDYVVIACSSIDCEIQKKNIKIPAFYKELEPDKDGRMVIEKYGGYQDIDEDINAFLKELGIEEEYTDGKSMSDTEPQPWTDIKGEVHRPAFKAIPSPKYPDITIYIHGSWACGGGFCLNTPEAIKVMGNIIKEPIIWENIDEIILDWDA